MIRYFLMLPCYAFAGLLDSYSSMLSLVHGIMANVCFFSGGVMLIASLAQFKSHRDNPTQVKLKVPVILMILGALLLSLSYFPSPTPEV